MTNEQLGSLLEAFANYYWSVPVSFVLDKVLTWHPELTTKQINGVLDKCNKQLTWHHCCVETEGVDEPELVVEHLVYFGRESLDQFLAARIDVPFFDCDEETLLKSWKDYLDLPEAKAISDYVETELGLDRKWSNELIQHCTFCQPSALCDGTSWVINILHQIRMSKIQFHTVDQVARFRELGNEFYQVYPNPVLRGWRPMEIENAPVLPDDIPEKDEDIPKRLDFMDDLFKQFGDRESAGEEFLKRIQEELPKRKVGPNDPCPCGSGKKYKKCCGRG